MFFRAFFALMLLYIVHCASFSSELNKEFLVNIPSNQKLVITYSYVPKINVEYKNTQSFLPKITKQDTLTVQLQLENGNINKYEVQLRPSSVRNTNFIGPLLPTTQQLHWYPAQIGTITSVMLTTPFEQYFTPDVLQFSIIITGDERETIQDITMPTASIEDMLQWSTGDSFSYHADFSLFRWQAYPDVLVFAFRDRDIQEYYLKRLAFFVEKKGTRGTVPHLSQIAHRRGWGANDFKATDLVKFFNEVHKSQQSSNPLVLTDQEKLLRSILLEARIMTNTKDNSSEDTKFAVNQEVPYGAIASYAKSDAPSLQKTLLFHELLHTIYFRDQNLRQKVATVWNSLSFNNQSITKSFFDTNGYDIDFDYLVKNEFYAYLLQRKISLLDRYLDIRILPESKIRISSNVRTEFKKAMIDAAKQLSQYVSTQYQIFDGDIRYVRQIQ